MVTNRTKANTSTETGFVLDSWARAWEVPEAFETQAAQWHESTVPWVSPWMATHNGIGYQVHGVIAWVTLAAVLGSDSPSSRLSSVTLDSASDPVDPHILI